jgi:phenylacetate-CoA ligase
MWLKRLFGSAYMAYHRLGQARYPFRPLGRIMADRDRRARRMIAYAYRYVPYYRETMQRLGLTPAEFQSADDLARLPILERGQLQRDPDYFTSTAPLAADRLSVRNSGTTGKPCVFSYDRRTLFQDAAFGERARAVLTPLLGRAMGYRMTVLATPTGSTTRVQDFHEQQAWLPRGVILNRQHLSMLDAPEVNVRRINEFKPDVIQSHGSYLAALFAYLKSTGAPMHRPKALRYTSDALPDAARRLITEEFSIPVFSRYEAMETPNLAFECEAHTGLHANIDLCPIRIVDGEGRTLPPGESGDVVISNLINRATVFLNYRLGDLARWMPDPCPCGRTLPLLSPVEGRTEDWLTLPSGRILHPLAATHALKYTPGIWQYQVVQQTPGQFRIALVADPQADRQAISARVPAEFVRVLGEPVQVEVQFVEAIPRTPAGKVRAVISLATRERLTGLTGQ